MRKFLKDAAIIVLFCIGLGLVLAFLAYLTGEDRRTIIENAIGWPALVLFARGLPLIFWLGQKSFGRANDVKIENIFA